MPDKILIVIAVILVLLFLPFYVGTLSTAFYTGKMLAWKKLFDKNPEDKKGGNE